MSSQNDLPDKSTALYSVEPDGTMVDGWIWDELLGDDELDEGPYRTVIRPDGSVVPPANVDAKDLADREYVRDEGGRFAETGGSGDGDGDDESSAPTVSSTDVKTMMPTLASAAQAVYDDWDESDEDTYAGGGICHIIADKIADKLIDKGIEATTVSAQIGEQHVWVVAKLKDGVYSIDIPPSTYESGGGYTWRKLKDVQITKDDVIVDRIDVDPSKFEDYLDMGGAGSGNFGHGGRPGEVGGSSGGVPAAAISRVPTTEKFTNLDPDDDYVYHVTLAPTAERIATEGLHKGRGFIGTSGAYTAHSKGRLFVTERSGVSFWQDRAEAHAFDQYDDPPDVAVLRIKKSDMPPMTPDPEGSRDAGRTAYYIQGSVHLGGAGSGNFGHGGRPGEVGGSSASGSMRVPPPPGTLPLAPGMIRAYHYTNSEEAFANILENGLSTEHARGSTYGEPNVIWFSTSKPGDFKHYVEVHLDPEELRGGVGEVQWTVKGADGRWKSAETPAEHQEVIDDFNKMGRNFALGVNKIPANRIVTHSEPWMAMYHQITSPSDPDHKALYDEKIQEIVKGELDWMGEREPEKYGKVIAAIKANYGGKAKALSAYRERLRLFQLGGEGSGNFGHSGRPGEIGGSGAGGPGAPYFQRNPRLAPFQSIPVVRSEGTGSRHPEAEVSGGKIHLYPKFDKLTPEAQDFVFAHEVGHAVLDEKGLASLVPDAEKLGIDVWDTDTLPYGQSNMHEAFADAFASYHTDKDVQTRYPAWATLVERYAAREKRHDMGGEGSGNFGHSGRPGEIGGSGKGGGPKFEALIDQIRQPDGGFTVQTTTGESPTHGFSVSIHPDRCKIIPVADLKLAHLVEFADQNADLLGQDGKYFGAWHNPENGQVYLDISTVTQDRAEAERLGQEHDQISFFDLGAGKVIDTPKKVIDSGHR